MQAITINDLKDTDKIEKMCSETNEPVFVTEDGDAKLVIMNIESYNRLMVAMAINEGLSDLYNGRVVDGSTALNELKAKYGL